MNVVSGIRCYKIILVRPLISIRLESDPVVNTYIVGKEDRYIHKDSKDNQILDMTSHQLCQLLIPVSANHTYAPH